MLQAFYRSYLKKNTSCSCTAKSPNLKTRKIILFQDSKSCFRIYNLGSIARKLSRQDFDNLENKIQNLENKIQNLENKI